MSGAELKPGARRLMFAGAPRLFIVSIVYVLLVFAISALQYRMTGAAGLYQNYMARVAAGDPHSFSMLLSFISPAGTTLAALIWLPGRVLRAEFSYYCLSASRRGGGGRRVISGAFFFCGKVMLIAVITTALTVLWSMLFFFPGVAAHYRYRQSYYILLDDPKKSALQCIAESKLLMAGNKLDLFLIDISFLGWHFLSAALIIITFFTLPFPLPVLAFWVAPYTGVTRAIYYDYLLEKATY